VHLLTIYSIVVVNNDRPITAMVSTDTSHYSLGVDLASTYAIKLCELTVSEPLIETN